MPPAASWMSKPQSVFMRMGCITRYVQPTIPPYWIRFHSESRMFTTIRDKSPHWNATMHVAKCHFLYSYKVLVILTAVDRRFGEYCSSLETRSTASGGVRLWKIWRPRLCQLNSHIIQKKKKKKNDLLKGKHEWVVMVRSLPCARGELLSAGIWTLCNSGSYIWSLPSLGFQGPARKQIYVSSDNPEIKTSIYYIFGILRTIIFWRIGLHHGITLMISTSWSTPLSPGKRGWNSHEVSFFSL